MSTNLTNTPELELNTIMNDNNGFCNTVSDTTTNTSSDIAKGDEALLFEKWYQTFAFKLTLALVLFFTFFRFIFGFGMISGNSMEPTLHDGQFMFFRRICYTPEQGDIILCTPEFYKENNIVYDMLIKRVIAVGGDTVDIDYETGDVLVNGVALDEDYILEKIDVTGYSSENPNPNYVEFPFTVDEGYVFVMGDNRNRSTDSRMYLIGEISEDDIVGKILFPSAN